MLTTPSSAAGRGTGTEGPDASRVGPGPGPGGWPLAGRHRGTVAQGPASAGRRGGRRAARRGGVLVLALALAGCASLGGRGEPGPLQAGAPPSALLTIAYEGGFVPVGADFSAVPAVTVHPDGRAITQGPVPAVFPGPLLPNLQVAVLAEATTAELVDAARAAGLLADRTYGSPPTADVPTTVVTLHVDGETYVHRAPSLGVGDGTEEGTGEAVPGVSDAERDARIALSGFVTTAYDVASSGEQEPFVPDAFAILARPATPDAMQPTADGIERQVVPWPVPGVLTAAETPVLVDGGQAVTLRDALLRANSLTLWEQDGATFEVWVRPLLPGEGLEDL